jgi:histidine ammonia-lyase
LTQEITLNTSGLSSDQVVAVARHGAGVRLSSEAEAAMDKSRALVEQFAVAEEPIYGVSTGFGALAQRHIPTEDRVQLQKSLIRSHAAGVGAAVETEVVRAMMLLRLKTMCSGKTGVRTELAQTYAALLNAGITPMVPEFGSLGCSGDLAPLSHCALVVMGEGQAFSSRGELRKAADLLAEFEIEPVELREKEGLALINGTDGMLGMLLLAIEDLKRLVDLADLIAAMSVEAQLGTDQVFRAELHEPLRSHPGQVESARRIFDALQGSEITKSHRHGDGVVQDAYSLRCAPQVAGAMRDTLAHAELVASRELAASIDNPVILENGEITSNGNFHGAPVAYVLDFLAIAAADLASISERRTDRFLDVSRNRGLPAFLAADPGVDSGMMIAQYTQASLVTDMKRLASPASVDSIPSSAMQEDHVSMGWHAARKLRQSVTNLRRVLAIELLVAARALELRAPLKPAAATGSLLSKLRETVPGVGPDRVVADEIAASEQLLLRLATQQ